MTVQPRCFYCSTREGPFEEDHVVPFSRGGTSLPRNLVLACKRCNGEKNDRLPSEWMPEPALPERVYELERMLVEWHEAVDVRRRQSASSMRVGMVMGNGIAAFLIEAVDSKGLRLRRLCINTVETPGSGVRWKGEIPSVFDFNPDLNEQPFRFMVTRRTQEETRHTDAREEEVEYSAIPLTWSEWKAWSDIKSVNLVDADDRASVEAFLVSMTSARLRQEQEDLIRVPAFGGRRR